LLQFQLTIEGREQDEEQISEVRNEASAVVEASRRTPESIIKIARAVIHGERRIRPLLLHDVEAIQD